MDMGKFIALAAAVAVFSLMPLHVSADKADDVFYDDFSGGELDAGKWRIAEKNWGGTVESDGKTMDYNGGVIAENVAVKDGELILTGLGNKYEGELHGINRDRSEREDAKRCGGAIATRDYYASGSYEIRAKIAPKLGCCSAMWTFEYEEDQSGDELKITNHEIDIEFPGRDDNNDYSFSHVLCTTWLTEEDYTSKSVPCGDQADGKYHTYRFDWHTGSDTEKPRVEYYFDDKLIHTAYDHIPTNESRFWLGLWFPKEWAGIPDFDTAQFVIDYVKITPFHEDGDTAQHETYSDGGWAEITADLPKGWLLWHSYSKYSALDSKLYLRDPDGVVKEIKGDFIHAMNASFGTDPTKFTFMAIDRTEEIWDIYLYDNGKVTDLTKNSGYRNEDPKWSPDGKQIVFKRGHWDAQADAMIYDIALLDVETKAVKMLTDDAAEEAMPCFSSDGTKLYYAVYEDETGSIMCMDMKTGKTKTIFSEPDVNAYYPVTEGGYLYFTKWHDAQDHTDELVRYDGKNIEVLPFSSQRYDCSDICPISNDRFIYSSDAAGNYDLYCYNGKFSAKIRDINTDMNELGADLFLYTEEKDKILKGDVNDDGKIDVTDIAMTASHIKGIKALSADEAERADADSDGSINVTDIAMIAAHIKGIKAIEQN